MESLTAQTPLLQATEAFVEKYIHENIGEKYVFHNFQHTYAVVEAAQHITEFFELKERDLKIVYIAAWFHDTGYSEGWEGHEERSAKLVETFLKEEQGIDDEEFIEAVKGCIMATKMPHNPVDLRQQIVCDADLSHLGEKSYWDRCGRVRQEFALTREMIMSDQEWIDFELNFMLGHEYHTEAARELYGDRKGKHVKQLYKRKQRLYPDTTPSNLDESKDNLKKKARKKAKKEEKAREAEKNLKLSRGVETMYRATYRTHVNLSSIADNKPTSCSR